MNITFTTSEFAPLALGFFGLGTGYLIWGPQELFGWPTRDNRVDRSTGVWGIWLPGFCQFVTGVLLFVGLTWFQVFKEAPLYMAALAFSAYGIHWFALGYNRWQGSDPRPNAASGGLHGHLGDGADRVLPGRGLAGRLAVLRSNGDLCQRLLRQHRQHAGGAVTGLLPSRYRSVADVSRVRHGARPLVRVDPADLAELHAVS